LGEKPKQGNWPAWQWAFLDQHQLDSDYLPHAQRWFAPLAEWLAMHRGGASAPLLVAVNGCQGSGKSTLCAWLSGVLRQQHGLRCLSLSLDDFYLTRTRRAELAAAVHPLLATRGVPGTHDMTLLAATLDALLTPAGPASVAVPRFDKARDDRRPQSGWEQLQVPLDLVLLEGWCLGARPQTAAELALPVNALERDEDRDGRWRGYVNERLRQDFLPLYERVDHWVMLQAPSFACVYRWRLEQEQKLARSAAKEQSRVMDDTRLARFIQFYQRLTEHCLATLPDTVDYLFTLDDQRQITASRTGARWDG